MKKTLTILLLLLCFIITTPLVYANPFPISPNPNTPSGALFWLIVQLGPIVAFFGFLILLAYFTNKKFSRRKIINGASCNLR